MQAVRRRIWTVGLIGAGLAGAFYAGIAFAADPRLDEADASVQKAIAQLTAAENPGVNKPFGGHREKALEDLRKAQAEIKKAKEWADDPKHQPKQSIPKKVSAH